MGSILEKGDVYLYLESSSFKEELDLSEINNEKDKGTKTYPLSFVIGGEQKETIKTYVKLINKETSQIHLAGKILQVKIKTENIKCEVDNIVPVVAINEGTIRETSIEIKATAIEEESGISKWCYKAEKEDENKEYSCENSNSTTLTHTFTGLTPEKKYTIYAYAVDKAGNGTEEDAVNKIYPTIKIMTPQELSNSNPSGLVTSTVAKDELTKRFQGTKASNYICVGGLCSVSEDSADYNLYRIIGINTSGNLKVLKKTSISSMAWNETNEYVTWSNSTLKKYLNEEWYPSLSYKSLINASATWKSCYFSTLTYLTGDGTTVYEQENVTCSNLETSTAAIGLPQVSDMLLADGFNTSCWGDSTLKTPCGNTWFFHDTSSLIKGWTISRCLYSSKEYRAYIAGKRVYYSQIQSFDEPRIKT